MIKTRIHKNPSVESNKSIYPLLARLSSKDTEWAGTIVLFTEENKGVVVAGSKRWPVGSSGSSGQWVSVNNTEVWEILPPNEELILSNAAFSPA